jgi:hypothetical protein
MVASKPQTRQNQSQDSYDNQNPVSAIPSNAWGDAEN